MENIFLMSVAVLLYDKKTDVEGQKIKTVILVISDHLAGM